LTIGADEGPIREDRDMADELEPMPEDWSRALVVVAHPDDTEYGAAAAIARWTGQGKDITYLLVTRGEAGIAGLRPERSGPLREAEQRAGAAEVGVDRLEFLDHRDGVIEEGIELRRDIAAAIRRHRPELVVTLNYQDTWGPGTWNTPDHRAVGRATLDAVSDAGNEWIFEDLADDGLEPWGGVRRVAIAGSPAPTHAVDVSESIEPAVRSLAAHRAYLEALDDRPAAEQAREWIERMTSMAAGRFGGRPCCTFELQER
jgi:LmbE family N-acetylglucosaminyl deacetylase